MEKSSLLSWPWYNTRLLTTLEAVQTRESLWEVVQGYLTRWRVEDTLRYVKTSYNVEHVRVLYCAIADGLKWLFVSHGRWRGPGERFDGKGDLQVGWADGGVSYLILLWRDDSGDICLQEVACSAAGYSFQGEDIGAVAL